MTRILIFILSLWSVRVLAQNDSYKDFKLSDYPKEKYSIKADTFAFRNLTIELLQVKLIDERTYDSKSSYCRIWLMVKNQNTVIDRLFFNDCEAVGGCSGIYASDSQVRKDYFILSKFGDYDGRILIIDATGKIISHLGGHYYISSNNKYLFSPYSSDLSGLTVYDLSINKVLFKSDSIQSYLGDFYFYDNKYFAIVSDDERKSSDIDIETFDFKTKTLIKSTVEEKYIVRAKQLKSYNRFTYAPCDCGQIKE